MIQAPGVRLSQLAKLIKLGRLLKRRKNVVVAFLNQKWKQLFEKSKIWIPILFIFSIFFTKCQFLLFFYSKSVSKCHKKELKRNTVANPIKLFMAVIYRFS
jgi:hypothetical protein